MWILQEVEVGIAMAEVARKHGISATTFRLLDQMPFPEIRFAAYAIAPVRSGSDRSRSENFKTSAAIRRLRLEIDIVLCGLFLTRVESSKEGGFKVLTADMMPLLEGGTGRATWSTGTRGSIHGLLFREVLALVAYLRGSEEREYRQPADHVERDLVATKMVEQ